MSEAERIAGLVLTREQRTCLLQHKDGKETAFPHWRTLSTKHEQSFQRVGLPLMQAGLIAWADRRSDYTRLTPLGQQMRDYLRNHLGDTNG